MDSEFKLGFWNYLQVGVLPTNIVDKWVDIGCNLFMSFRFQEGISKKEDMIALLDKAHSVGKKVIINDSRNEYLRLKTMSREEFRKGVQESIKDFGSHPATYGFYGGDEPFKDQEENFSYTMSLLKELSPNLHHYGNLLPYWSGLLWEEGEKDREDSYYLNKIEKIVKDGNLDILAFDQYTQCYDETADQKDGIKKYFLGMANFLKVSRKYNIPLYVSLLAIEHFNYREPSEHDIRWQIHTCATMGAKGVIWFYFHTDNNDVDFFNPPFLGEKALITPMYGKIQRQQYLFNERYKKTFDNIEVERFYFLNDDIGKEYRFDASKEELIERLDVKYKDRLALVSIAHYLDNPNKKIAIVMNCDQKFTNAFSLYPVNKEAKHFDLSAGNLKIFELS